MNVWKLERCHVYGAFARLDRLQTYNVHIVNWRTMLLLLL
jgi:hypothetical protein